MSLGPITISFDIFGHTIWIYIPAWLNEFLNWLLTPLGKFLNAIFGLN
ncbi:MULTISPECIES: hypothetical protein [unclassified Archaeoglobus]|jgi:hypothetical protein|nr:MULTISPECIES: hypothetical protein [unclassified Archaeoglobus]